MALPISVNDSSSTPDMPVPYRLDTSAILIVRRPISDEALTAIRRAIEPRTGFWQFELRPWMYWTAISAAAVLTAAFVVFAVLVRDGVIR